MPVPTAHEVDVTAVFEALVAPIRREVIEILGRGPRPAGDLADAAGVAASTMSRHLKVLLSAGLVEAWRDEEDARIRVFSLRFESMYSLRAWLDDLETAWRGCLASFREHVERRTSQ